MLGNRSFALLVLLLVLAPLSAADLPPTIDFHIDATDAPRKRLQATLVIPVKPGPLTLYYPKWIAGEHGPTGPITDLSGIKIQGAGKAIPWRRDEADTYAIYCNVPDGVDKIQVSLELLASPSKDGFSAAASLTPRLGVINWNHILLYPKGTPIQEIRVRPSITLPEGWKFGCALAPTELQGAKQLLEETTLERVCDSPVLCGKYYLEIPIGPKQGIKHFLCVAADSEAALKITPEMKENLDRLVVEAGELFGSRHYRSYRFLLTLSDHVAHFGLEHHECNDSRAPERMLVDPGYRRTWYAWLLSHEYVHSWNGKYRRPAGMITETFQQPARTRLLWVYEGLTQYLGLVLAARSGLWTPELSRDNMARVAEWSRNQKGRDWRSLEDTAAAAQHLYAARTDGGYRRRGVDFYDEGALIWLDADTLIREKTNGKASLDTFCKAFFGGKGGVPSVKGYEFEEIVKTLNTIVPYDWRGFFEKRVMQPAPDAPLEGLSRSGWKVTYGKVRSELQEFSESESRTIDLSASIGLLMKEDGTVVDVVPEKAADRAGLAAGMKLIAVNQRRWTPELLRAAIAATKDGKGKLQLMCENHDYFESFALKYAEGEKYPHLEAISSPETNLLIDILKPTNFPPVSPSPPPGRNP